MNAKYSLLDNMKNYKDETFVCKMKVDSTNKVPIVKLD